MISQESRTPQALIRDKKTHEQGILKGAKIGHESLSIVTHSYNFQILGRADNESSAGRGAMPLERCNVQLKTEPASSCRHKSRQCRWRFEGAWAGLFGNRRIDRSAIDGE